MDSVTQFTLGACVGVAVLGRKIGPRRAALTGGVLGTLPDLDVFLAPEDPIDAFVQHRGWTHSLFIHAALTPVFGEALRRLFKALRDQPYQSYAAVFLCLTTHALLDAMTVYGTRLFWPLFTEPVGLGSIFIIDPLYTLPLLVAMVWAFVVGSMTLRLRKALVICFGLSTAYLSWTAIAQFWMTQRASAWLAEKKVSPDQILASPAPFNTFLWRVIGVDSDRYFNLYMPIFGGASAATLYAYPRHLRFENCPSVSERIAQVAKFSDGYYTIKMKGNRVSVADLRMGLTPNYAFQFVLGDIKSGKLVAAQTRRINGRGDVKQDFGWLVANLQNRPETRPAEAEAQIDLNAYSMSNAEYKVRSGGDCRS